MNIKQKLSRIYKANQCTDINDCDIAIDEVYKLRKDCDKKGISSKLLYRRLISLGKRKKKIQISSVRKERSEEENMQHINNRKEIR